MPHLLTRDLKGASERQLCAGRITKLFDYTMGNGKVIKSFDFLYSIVYIPSVLI